MGTLGILQTTSKAVIGLLLVAVSFWATLALLDRGAAEYPAATTIAAGEPSAAPTAPSWKGWNEALYLAVNPDVGAAIARKEFVSARQHYELAGFAEGRKGATIPSNWDEAQYLKTNPDVATAVSQSMFVSGYHHFLAAGQVEGRRGDLHPPKPEDDGGVVLPDWLRAANTGFPAF